jgi:hypothetical protein
MTDVNGETEATDDDGRLGAAGSPVEGARDDQSSDAGEAAGGPGPGDHLTGGGDPVEGKR